MGAATQGRIELARLLVDSRAKLDAVDHDGSTALMFAVRSGESEFAKFLIDKGANVNAKDAHGNTVLDILLMSQNPSVTTDLLLKAGAKPNQYIRTMITRCATDVQERAANAFSAGSGGSLNSTREFILGKLQEFQKSRLFDADFVNLARTSFVAALTDALRLQQVRRTSTRTDGDRQVDMKFAELMEEILEAPRAFTTALLSAKSSIAAKDWVRAGDQIDQALALQPDDPDQGVCRGGAVQFWCHPRATALQGESLRPSRAGQRGSLAYQTG